MVSHIFISYPRTESEFASKLANDLKNAGIKIWLDIFDRNIKTGDDWRTEIQNAIDNSFALISIICPQYVVSKYCMFELSRADDRGIPVMPVLLSPLNSPTDWPIALQSTQYLSFENWDNPEIYVQQLKALKADVGDKFPEASGETVDLEIRYLNNLIAQLESKKSRGVLEYVELEALADAESEIRPIPDDDEWGYALLTVNSDENHPPNGQMLGNKPRHVSTIQQIFDIHRRFVLLGKPGSGKTTTLRRMVRDLARRRMQSPATTPLPIIRYLPQWGRETSLESFIRDGWSIGTDPFISLKNGDSILFLDGLNEMGAIGKDKVEELRIWLNSRNSPQRIVVTCRELDYDQDLVIESLLQVVLMDLNRAQIDKFARNYLEDESKKFLGLIYPDTGLDKLLVTGLPSFIHDGTDVNKQLVEGLQRLARNPYMLSALIIIFQDSGELPHNAGGLFRTLSKAMWERERRRNSVGWIPFDEMEMLFGRLAFDVIEQDIPLNFPVYYAMEHLGSQNYDLLMAAQHAGFVEINGMQVSFFHQLVLEYFAAVELSKRDFLQYLVTEYDHDFERVVRSPSKWDRVLIALCGITNDSEETLLEILFRDPILAAMCVESGIPTSDYTKELLDEVFSQLNLVLDDFLEPGFDDFEDIVRAFRDKAISSEVVIGTWGEYFGYETEWLCDVLINDWRREAREVAAHLLHGIGNDNTISPLMQALDDKSWFVASAAANALNRIGGSQERKVVLEWYRRQQT